MSWLIYGALAYAAYKLVQSVSDPTRQRTKGERSNRPTATSARRSAWQVLELEPGASRDDIRRAYQAKIRQYHPDRVANAAPELQQLAERRTKEINAAYAELKGRG